MNQGNKNKLRDAVASQSQLDPIDAIAADIDIAPKYRLPNHLSTEVLLLN